MNNKMFTPDSKIKTSIPRQPIKPRSHIRHLNLTGITERNIIFNQMISEASETQYSVSSTPSWNVTYEPVCPNAPRKPKTSLNYVSTITPRDISKDF